MLRLRKIDMALVLAASSSSIMVVPNTARACVPTITWTNYINDPLMIETLTTGTSDPDQYPLTSYVDPNDLSDHVVWWDPNSNAIMGSDKNTFFWSAPSWFRGATLNPNASQSLNAYAGTDLSRHIHHVGADNHVYDTYLTSGAMGYQQVDLIAVTRPGNAGTITAASGSFPFVAGYWRANEQHVFYIDTNNHLRELFNASPEDNSQWVDNDVTVASGMASNSAENYAGFNLGAYTMSDGSEHVFYLNGLAHVEELYTVGTGAAWHFNDVTAHAVAGIDVNPVQKAGSHIEAFAGSDGSQYVDFVDFGGYVEELTRPNVNGTWVDNNPTREAVGAPPSYQQSSSDITADDLNFASVQASDGSRYIAYVSYRHRGVVLESRPGQPWRWADLGTIFSPGESLNLSYLTGFEDVYDGNAIGAPGPIQFYIFTGIGTAGAREEIVNASISPVCQ